jgi:hypothetical protein
MLQVLMNLESIQLYLDVIKIIYQTIKQFLTI